jgi:hypothetical protein
MRRLILLISVVLITADAQSQFIEKIFLKDSITIYTGWIVEQVPQDYIKILRQKEKDTVTIKTENIWKIVRVIDTKHYHSPFEKQGNRDQAVFFEALGNAFFYSVNYDIRLKKGDRKGWGIRAGLGVLSVIATDTVNHLKGKLAVTTIPFILNYTIGQKRSSLELGAGVTFLVLKLKKLSNSNGTNVITGSSLLNYSNNSPNAYINGIIGYRYTSLKNGIIFRTGLTPYFSDGGISLLAGISLGYHFGKG